MGAAAADPVAVAAAKLSQALPRLVDTALRGAARGKPTVLRTLRGILRDLNKEAKERAATPPPLELAPFGRLTRMEYGVLRNTLELVRDSFTAPCFNKPGAEVCLSQEPIPTPGAADLAPDVLDPEPNGPPPYPPQHTSNPHACSWWTTGYCPGPTFPPAEPAAPAAPVTEVQRARPATPAPGPRLGRQGHAKAWPPPDPPDTNPAAVSNKPLDTTPEKQ